MSQHSEVLSILIVENSAPARDDLQLRLERTPGWSLNIGTAADPEAALGMLKQSPYDLIFLSSRLPGAEGLQFLVRVRQLHTKSAVIVTCPDTDAQLAVDSMKHGALDCLSRSDLTRIDFAPILRRLVEMRNIINQNLELRQVNQMKNEFIANVSHELRTPLTVILGYARTLQEATLGELNTSQRKAVDSIIARSEDLLEMLNHILRVREIVEGRQVAALHPMDLREVWRAHIDKAAKDLDHRGLSMQCSFPPNAVWVMADPASFGDICDNLLSNAVKFSPKNGVIKLALGISAGRAWMSLQDQGSGIAPEILPHLFEDFSTASVHGPTREHSGLGLGLSLCKHAVELHSGTIWLESPGPGQGCIAHVSLPLAQADRPATTVEKAAAIEKRRILIVEDNPDIIEIIRLFISGISSNLDLTTAHSGFEALDSIRNQVPHLIIMDVMMPGMTGLELLARLRRVPETDRIPVLVLTGYTDAAQQAWSAGAQEVLIKPFDRKVFMAKVLQLLQQGETAARRE
ncbi:MAG: response regulator [Elusimicrobiota bacterium]